MLQINRSDNPAAELSQIALISNNKHTNQQANKAWNISFHESFQSGAFGSCLLFILLLFKAMNEIPVAGTTKETAPDVLTVLPRCCWTVSKGGWVAWKREETTEPGQRKQRKDSTPTVFVPYSFLPGPERMRHLQVRQLNVTHSHTPPTRNSAVSNKIKPETQCPVSLQCRQTDARDLLVNNYRRIYPQRKEDIKLIPWWLFFTLKHGASYPFYWDEHIAVIYSNITPGLHYCKLNYYREYPGKHVCHSLFGHDAIAMITLSSPYVDYPWQIDFTES